MLSLRIVFCTVVIFALYIEYTKAIPTENKEVLSMLSDEDGTAIERDFLNYLAGRRFVKRLRNQIDNDDLQRKRNYWRQCAFNAVSCFGK